MEFEFTVRCLRRRSSSGTSTEWCGSTSRTPSSRGTRSTTRSQSPGCRDEAACREPTCNRHRLDGATVFVRVAVLCSMEGLMKHALFSQNTPHFHTHTVLLPYLVRTRPLSSSPPALAPACSTTDSAQLLHTQCSLTAATTLFFFRIFPGKILATTLAAA